MSTKTITKRVALATVVALGAGVLSLVTVSSANATLLGGATIGATNNGSVNGALSGAASNLVPDVMYVGSATNTTGAVVTTTALSSGATQESSVGLVTLSDIAGNAPGTAGTTQTATLLSSGSLVVFGTIASSSDSISLLVSGATIKAAGSASSINASSTAMAATGGAATTWTASISPNSGVTSFTVSAYAQTVVGATASSPTTGTLVGFINVSVVATSAAGTVSAAKSGIYYTPSATTTTALTGDPVAIASLPAAPDAGTSASGQKQWAQIRVLDAYGSSILSTTGILTAVATNGAYVSLTASGGAGTPTQASAFYSGAPDQSILTVSDPSSSPLSTTVTIAYNGVTIGTKNFTFTGDIAKITLSAPSNGVTGSTGSATIAFADSAGNAIYPAATATAGSGSAYYPSTSEFTDPNTTNSYVTGGSVTTQPASSVSGVYTFTCGPNAGSASVAVKYTNVSGVVTTSNALTAKCAGLPYSYTAKLDKAKYAPGDIATLTVTFLDSLGNVAGDKFSGISNVTGSTVNVPSLVGGYLTGTNGSATNYGQSGDATTNGVISYKLVVGAPTADPYGGQLLVSFPVVNAVNAAQSTVTVGYSISSGSTSLNDVLKGIVSLIASINKQIAALAKLVTKK